MTRRAYLIGGSYLKKLDGVRADIDAWKEFLQSSVGGSWVARGSGPGEYVEVNMSLRMAAGRK